ncbi:putative hydrogenase nickel incorporation protein HypA [Shewanella colwelliana]|uniref:Hydrogenase maturation factor HypA n=1 Tax=Shewanella colwelliana TaxID=23 RepID=A0A1E5IQ91_SHECO|nr:hydrogenase/urease nickel incorporation protein HypA [Shewanella colwelliana]MDX1280350.1 hydrogenase/urease nickel incorporation protein HypA [Shewanella colwelliana]OEG72103.1 hydrogenase maturation nickel metallochaperone HypA [Shewanella colwelliana]GIU23102.1 putative hydrogenase nickel incorporation protein HypA [Shewanella colwelliana]GIU39563.1 putative hydrogenase nickel incorporation protein HypA [Shewanella colwelliana]
MHEYSIVTALLEQCEQHAEANNANKITKVVIKVGVLSGVEPALLQTAFDTFKLEGPAHEAQLTIKHQPLVIECAQCGSINQLEERSIVCPNCNSFNTKILEGEEMLLMQLELETD